ncbi:hypothetical protein FSP39_008835 [Pinctada imbricata]|uniref:TIR domain-containing protein n=1 Tax=Pinctada imbricata TaxID=66713 RepID=A0AA89BLR8_PINIB|nr:hypothetical protein FSP39_008835 [Pinctada imbricata]
MHNIFHCVICDCTEYFSWEGAITPLFCPNSCQRYIDLLDDRAFQRCCSCEAVPEWSCNSDISIGTLYIEYINSKGWNQLIEDSNSLNHFTRVDHTTGFMSELPQNICDFPNLVHIDFSGNDIHETGGLSCMRYLDTVILSGNRISSVGKNTFVGLKYLRKIDLSGNLISSVGLGTLSASGIGIAYMNFSDNILQNIDMTNVVIENPFCRLNYSGNRLTDITNKRDWRVDTNKSYGSGGTVDLTNNFFRDFFDLRTLGFPDLVLFGKLIRFSFDLRNSKWDCNCRMLPFLTLSELILRVISSDIFLVRCSSPEHMKGNLVIDYVKNKSLDLFICQIKMDCPSLCYCFDQPSQNRTVVNCSHRGLDRMPRYLPKNPNLVVDLRGNRIRHIENMSYLSNVSALEKNQDLFAWINSKFVPSLEGHGYRLFLPYRDLEPGSIREEELRERMFHSKNVIVFLSEDYISDDSTWSVIEWRLAWNAYRSCHDKEIILINFDQMRACNVENVAAKAFIRLGLFVDFANKKHELMKSIMNRLGNIFSSRQQRFFKNFKPTFNSNKIGPMKRKTKEI